MICNICNTKNQEDARFCTECGNPLKGLKGKLFGMKDKFLNKANNAVNDIKNQFDNKISELISRIENDGTIVGNYKVPESRKASVTNALTRFQSKIGDPTQNEISYEVWINNLPDMLEGSKCTICFGKFDRIDDVLICPKCETGGHNEHIMTWVQSNNLCPFCRENISIRDLMKLK